MQSAQGDGRIDAGKGFGDPAPLFRNPRYKKADEEGLPHETEEVVQKAVAEVAGMGAEELGVVHGGRGGFSIANN